MKSLFIIIFGDKTTYRGGDYSNSGWLNIPDKPIKRIIYRLPQGGKLILDGYDTYFHMTEAVTGILGKNKGKQKIEFDYIMGQRKGIITCYKINIKTKDIKKEIFNEEDKFIKGLNKIGWKGIKNKEEEK